MKRRMSESLEAPAVRDIRYNIVFTEPSRESVQLQQLILNHCIQLISSWSEQAERHGALGRLTVLKSSIKDYQSCIDLHLAACDSCTNSLHSAHAMSPVIVF